MSFNKIIDRVNTLDNYDLNLDTTDLQQIENFKYSINYSSVLSELILMYRYGELKRIKEEFEKAMKYLPILNSNITLATKYAEKQNHDIYEELVMTNLALRNVENLCISLQDLNENYLLDLLKISQTFYSYSDNLKNNIQDFEHYDSRLKSKLNLMFICYKHYKKAENTTNLINNLKKVVLSKYSLLNM